MNVTFLHESIIEYYAAEHLKNELNTPDWFEIFESIGGVEQYSIWSRPISLMCSLILPEDHAKIIQRYVDWEEHEYGLNYLVKHLSHSEDPQRVFDIITPQYVTRKKVRWQSIGLVLDDIQSAINVAVNGKDLVSAFRFGLLDIITI